MMKMEKEHLGLIQSKYQPDGWANRPGSVIKALDRGTLQSNKSMVRGQ